MDSICAIDTRVEDRAPLVHENVETPPAYGHSEPNAPVAPKARILNAPWTNLMFEASCILCAVGIMLPIIVSRDPSLYYSIACMRAKKLVRVS